MAVDWKSAWSSIAMAFVMLAVVAWVAYFWERSTGLTWASRRRLGQISTAEHLAKTRNVAIGTTLIGASFGVVYYLTRPR